MEGLPERTTMENLEWSREPHGSTSGRSLGQALDDMGATGSSESGRLIRPPEPETRAVPSGLDDSLHDSDRTDCVGSTDLESTNYEITEDENGHVDPPPVLKSECALSIYDLPQANEDFGVQPTAQPVPSQPKLKDDEGEGVASGQHGETCCTIAETPESLAIDSEGPQGFQAPEISDTNSRSSTESDPNHSAPADRIIRGSDTQDVAQQAAVPAQAQPTASEGPSDPIEFPANIIGTSVKIAFAALLCYMLQYILMGVILASLLELFVGGVLLYERFLRRPPVATQPTQPTQHEPPSRDEGVDPVPAEDPARPAGVTHHPIVLDVQCHQCGLDCLPRSAIHCPSRHPICLNCLFNQVIDGTAYNGDREVACTHVCGCRQPFEDAELRTLPSGLLSQLTNSNVFEECKTPPIGSEDGQGEVEHTQEELERQRSPAQDPVEIEGRTDLDARLQDALSRCTALLRQELDSRGYNVPGKSYYYMYVRSLLIDPQQFLIEIRRPGLPYAQPTTMARTMMLASTPIPRRLWLYFRVDMVMVIPLLRLENAIMALTAHSASQKKGELGKSQNPGLS
ncbi:hypothetical protein NMY22_g14822 [Coprinellus aureogranulatus]|nr:hypothetical protein NMY22_g14822 [Coprinellus aureogranulatus]